MAEPTTLLDIRPDEFLRRTSGRETFVWTWPPGRDVVVKRTRQTLAPFPSRRDVRPGGRREHDNLLALATDGIPVPAAVTWCEERGRLLLRPARSVVVMERIEHRENLKERLARCDAAERRSWGLELVRIVARLHARGWRHRDLYLQHFLVRWPEQEGLRRLVLIDVGRARRERQLSRRWIVKDLAALLHSTPACVGARERLAFLARYLDARDIVDRDERRRFARSILAKAARMGAHVPRDERGA